MSRLPELASLEHQHAALELHLKDEMERLRHSEQASVH
jgi:hypothetical protein